MNQASPLLRMQLCVVLLSVAAAVPLGVTATAADEDPFASHVRPTEPRTPAAEQAGFQLPPGFVAELVAAEERIAKPMNLAFDDAGRLWVSCSLEYPYAAPLEGPSRDFIKVFEDTDGDGTFEKATTFADGLNIPIGLLPVADGVICFSIPNIWHLRDTDGDGRADERIVLYGPMGWQRDTHGMCNAFRQGADGWIYACHGFNNETTVSGTDGHAISMQSGNTFRFRPDGSRIEHFTWGQVNPFGMDVDVHGDLFTADCHTKPVTLLLPEGRYESFGKPHDGLGFVPAVMDHLHGSTAIGGIAIYEDVRFPPEYGGSSFGGNVMTSRINRNRLERHGATVRAVDAGDFLTADDPWFRPVDLRTGPDGALYVADFYNRIIGHYEVPLEHPGRDRTRGRIWRIVYRGDDAQPTPPLSRTRLDRDGVDGLVKALQDTSLIRRSLARERLIHEADPSTNAAVGRLLSDATASATSRAEALWCLARRQALATETLAAAAADADPLLREHAMRVAAAGQLAADGELFEILGTGLADSDPQVARAAAMSVVMLPTTTAAPDAMGRLCDVLVDRLVRCDAEDVHLRHALALALRSRLRDEQLFKAIATKTADGTAASMLADICLGLDSTAAADTLVQLLEANRIPRQDRITAFVEHAVAHASAGSLETLAGIVRERFSDDLPFQLRLLESARRGLERQGLQAAPSIRSWADAVARQLLELDASGQPAQRPVPLAWTASPLPGRKGDNDPWPRQERMSSDGILATFRSSLPRGEPWRGLTRSEPFTAEAHLSFFLAGHAGYPDKPPHERNVVRLCDAETGEVLREAFPPRSDTAQPVRWDTGDLAGRSVVVEIVDGDKGDAYAWLAAGRFSIERLDPSDVDGARQTAAALVAGFRLNDLVKSLGLLITELPATRETRLACATALNALDPDARLDAVSLAFSQAAASDRQRSLAGQALATRSPTAAEPLLEELLRVGTSEDQRAIAARLAADEAGCQFLESAVARGICSARLLAEPAVSTRIDGLRDESLRARLLALAASAPAADEPLARLLDDRRSAYREHPGDASDGLAVFRKQCIACHQVAGEGAKVGPQLDGIGNRGLDRVSEDLMDPNRNVDVAFRTTTFLMNDGRVLSGLVASETDDVVLCVDQQGKEFAVPTDAIEERRLSPLSLMPANFHETLTPEDVRNLLAYLLSLRT
jgi:putative heme-binding domain-containing protein